MKRVLLAAAMTMMSVSAFANMCEVDMVDSRTNRLITTIRAYDYGDDCREGMKECRKEIRLRGLLGRADCVRATVNNPYPDPRPNPYPWPNPNPGPIGSVDVRRMLSNGESAILENKIVTVLGSSYSGSYAVRSTDGWNTITNNVRRDALSVTSGCNLNLCTSDSVIDVNTARYVTIVGLSYNDRFVTRSTDGWNTLTSHFDRMNLAETKSGLCAYSRFSRDICVGRQVINQQNRYSTVIGIQQDGRVVLRSTDGWNTITTNVTTDSLVVTR